MSSLSYNLPIEQPSVRRILTVTQVNRLVAGMLGEFFADIWIEGEVSNLRAYPSGHLYFTLKDPGAQIAAVCFRSAAQRLKFRLSDGLKVIGHGHLDLYGPSGKYQIILEELEPKGQGALQLAFEQLKAKLAREGLFAQERKKPIPRLPGRVGIVTSPVGAAIHDMLRTLRLHRAPVRVILYPALVQGEGAAEQIAQGIDYFNARGDIDVIIVGRGGGSLEDLWPFNEEIVARAIARSRIPVISGVGHEVDYTIADFVADLRATTPTAAAHQIASGWKDLTQRLAEHYRYLVETIEQTLLAREQRLEQLIRHRSFEQVRLILAHLRHRVDLAAASLRRQVMNLRHSLILRLRVLMEQAAHAVQVALERRLARWQAGSARLHELSPLAGLARGYAICQRRDGSVVSRVGQVRTGEELDVTLRDGRIECEVVKTNQGA